MAVATQQSDRDKALTERDKALETAMAQIDRQFGKGAIMRLGEVTKMNVEAIPTGSIALDLSLGIGGVPRGRIVEIFGPESSGKTTWHSTSWPRPNIWAGWSPMWTPNMPWIRSTPRAVAWM